MFNLSDKNISYIIFSPEKDYNSTINNKIQCEKLCSILYSKNYTIIPIVSYQNNIYENCFIGICNEDNDSIRKDSLYLLDEFSEDSILIKYKNELTPKRVYSNGSEILLEMCIYDSNTDNKSYIYNGVSFTFNDKKRYQFLSYKEELKNGMIIEFFNNDRWTKRKIVNVDVEYEKMYKLLIKYNKLRVCTE